MLLLLAVLASLAQFLLPASLSITSNNAIVSSISIMSHAAVLFRSVPAQGHHYEIRATQVQNAIAEERGGRGGHDIALRRRCVCCDCTVTYILEALQFMILAPLSVLGP